MTTPATRPRVVAVHQPEFLPWLGFVDKLRQADVFVLLDCVQFEKNYFQNRNRVRAAGGPVWLTVPVITAGRSHQRIVDVVVRNDQAWRRKHVTTLEQCYRRAPFFDPWMPGLRAIYQHAWDRLVDLNVAALEWLREAFGVSTPFVRASALQVDGQRSSLLVNICAATRADVYLSGVSGRDYLDVDLFRARGIEVRFQEFVHPVYAHCHQPFLSDMSAVDLLFHAGPDSLETVARANRAASAPRES